MKQHQEERKGATMGGHLAASAKSSTPATTNDHIADNEGEATTQTVTIVLRPPPTVDEATMKARAAAARAYALSGEPSKKRISSAAAGPSSASTVHHRVHANNGTYAATLSQSSLRGGRPYSNHYPRYPYVYPPQHSSWQQPRHHSTDQQNRCRPPPASGWTSVVDPSTGRTYYANSHTGASSWDPPPATYSSSHSRAPGPRCGAIFPQSERSRLQDASKSTFTPTSLKTTPESAALISTQSPSITTAARSDASAKVPTLSRTTATKSPGISATGLSSTTKKFVDDSSKATAEQVSNRAINDDINNNTCAKRPAAKSVTKKSKVTRNAAAEATVSFLNCNNASPHDAKRHQNQKQPAPKRNGGGTESPPPPSLRRNNKSRQKKSILLPSNGTTSRRWRNLSATARLAASSIQNAQPKTLPPGCDARLELGVGRNRVSVTSSQSNDAHVFNHYCDEDDEDYANFVKSLGLAEQNDEETGVLSKQDDDSGGDDDDDEEDFFVVSLEDDDDDDDSKEALLAGSKVHSRPNAQHPFQDSPTKECVKASPVSDTTEFAWDIDGFDPDFYDELEDELGGLEEEDLEAAIASLLGTTSTSYAHAQKYDAIMEDANGIQVDGTSKSCSAVNADNNGATTSNSSFSLEAEIIDKRDSHRDCEIREATTPLRTVTGLRVQAAVTHKQVDRLQTLLNRHYQALIQQSVLSVHAASKNGTKRAKDKGDFLSRETHDDIAQILDASIGMVQDLDQNRKDAIRNSIQLKTNGSPVKLSRVLNLESETEKRPEAVTVAGNRVDENHTKTGDERVQPEQRRLTRAAFTKTLQQTALDRKSVFNVKGLHRLQETFHSLDLCHNPVSQARYVDDDGDPAYTKACRSILKEAGANYEEKLIPGISDLSEFFSTPQEFLGDEFAKPCSEEQKQTLRRDRTLFTSGEDNLVLRGVNLYGEKQWLLIADRYLPTRSGNTIAQRYSKLCLLLYLANGISVDHTGNLQKPPKLESVEDIDNDRVALIKRAEPPAILNVHRWSLEEDLTLLRAVPCMGHMWAELGARLIPHRDRGHLRKRYQVLQRRVRTAVSRSSKKKNPVLKLASQQKDTMQYPKMSVPEQRQTAYPRLLQPQSFSGTNSKLQLGTLSGSNTSAAMIAKSSVRTQSQDPPSYAHVSKGANPFPTATNLYSISAEAVRMPAQSADAGDAGSSRFAFEHNGEDGVELSQMSRIEEYMDDNDEFEFVGAVPNNRLSEAKKPMQEKLSHTLASSHTSRSRGCAISTVLERANKPGLILSCQDTKRKRGFPNSLAPNEMSEKMQETPKLRKRPGSPDAAALFAAADASRLHGVNFGALESRHGGGASEQGSSSSLCDQIMEADAVSALNSLSSSPARSLRDRPALHGKAANTLIAPEEKRARDGPSFFAQAVGGVHQRDKKKMRK